MLLFPKFNKETLTGWIGDGISAAAPILLITGAGGAFGTILKEVQIGDTLGNLLAGYQLGIFLPFIIAAAFKTAQGSSTVALIATSALIAPLLINYRIRIAKWESTGCNGNRSRCNDDIAC
jgi:gluconate:H+ symporter, GntP family